MATEVMARTYTGSNQAQAASHGAQGASVPGPTA